jgi:hypothetical protein
VRERQRVRFRLGFDPTQVGVMYVGRLQIRYVRRLVASRIATWRVRAFAGRDEFIVTARSALGDTSYAVCFRTR